MEDEWDLAAVSADHDFAGAGDQVAGFESQDLHIELLFVGHCLTAKVVSPYGCHDAFGFSPSRCPRHSRPLARIAILNRCRVALRACLIATRMQFSGKTVRRYNRRGISPYTGGRSRPSPCEIEQGMAGQRGELFQRYLDEVKAYVQCADELGYAGYGHNEHHLQIEGFEETNHPGMTSLFIGLIRSGS